MFSAPYTKARHDGSFWFCGASGRFSVGTAALVTSRLARGRSRAASRPVCAEHRVKHTMHELAPEGAPRADSPQDGATLSSEVTQSLHFFESARLEG